MHYPKSLLALIEAFRTLPGVGSKSAERFAFEVLSWKPEKRKVLIDAFFQASERLSSCPVCGALREGELCTLCSSHDRDRQMLCVIASPKDLYALERTQNFRGQYHVLDGLLSPLDAMGPESIGINRLVKRVKENEIGEVILALETTLEGDATALFLKQELEALNVPVSRLAFGLPMGSSLEYVDSDTLAHAFSGRLKF